MTGTPSCKGCGKRFEGDLAPRVGIEILYRYKPILVYNALEKNKIANTIAEDKYNRYSLRGITLQFEE